MAADNPVKYKAINARNAVTTYALTMNHFALAVAERLILIDPLCLELFFRVWRKHKASGLQQLRRALWRQSVGEKRPPRPIASRNSKRRPKARPRTISDATRQRYARRKRGRGAHKRGPRTKHRTGKRVGHHRVSGRRYVY